LAARKGDLKIIKILLNAGADINIQNSDGSIPILGLV
jgi:ankyrin repeat protein